MNASQDKSSRPSPSKMQSLNPYVTCMNEIATGHSVTLTRLDMQRIEDETLDKDGFNALGLSAMRRMTR